MEENLFGQFLYEKRKQQGLSQYQLGSLLGVSGKAVSKWERGVARPKSQLLYKLSAVLGVTADALLIGAEYPRAGSAGCLSEPWRDRLWDEAYRHLRERYGDRPPIEIVSRFENEKLVLANTDIVQFFRVISAMAKKAEESGMPVFLQGSAGASFLAYLFGASDVNPLPAHYHCPRCRAVEFVPGMADGWMLAPKACARCGTPLVRDGHDMPFEVLRHTIGRNMGFELVLCEGFYETAKSILLSGLPGYMVTVLEPPAESMARPGVSKVRTFVCPPMGMGHANGTCAVRCSQVEYQDRIYGKPYISLLSYDAYERCAALERRVDVARSDIDILDREAVELLLRGETDGIPDFGLYDMKELLARFRPGHLGDAIAVYGIGLLASALPREEASAFIRGIASLSEAIVYRDDVFRYLDSRLKEHGYYDFGLAYAVMDRARRGAYRGQGMDPHTKAMLRDIGVEEHYISRLEKVPYLFPKSQGIVSVKYALTLLWIKVHHPEDFRRLL